jgi:hypothetical protein
LTAVAFDVHLTEVLTPWMLGFATASAPRSELLEDLAAGIEFIGATHVCCVPSLIEATFGGLKNGVGQVKYLISGGEKITDNVRTNLQNKCISYRSSDTRELGKSPGLNVDELLWPQRGHHWLYLPTNGRNNCQREYRTRLSWCEIIRGLP